MKWIFLILFLITASATAAFFLLTPPPPPVGVARFRPTGSKGTGLATTPYTGNYSLPITVQYAGPRKGFDVTTQTWVHGKAAPISVHSMETLEDAAQEARFWVQDRPVKGELYYGVGYGFRRRGLLGGSASGSGSS